jgi:hypothetical protein
MPSPWDASIKLLYATDLNTFFTIDDVGRGQSFDVIANVEIGENLNENVDRFDIRVGIVNLTQSRAVAAKNQGGNLTPQNNTTFNDEVRVNIPGNWSANAEVGDVLQAVASYKVTAGANVDFSTALSNTFVVS